MRILVVDDDDDVRAAVIAALAGDGDVIVEVPTARQALEELQTEPYELVIAELLMPGMNGLGLAQAMAELALDVPVMLLSTIQGLTANTLEGVLVRHVLAKPFARRDLRQRVAALRRDAAH